MTRPPPGAVRAAPILLCLAVFGLSLPGTVADRGGAAPEVGLGAAEAVRGGPIAGLVQYRLDVRSIKPTAPGTVRVGVVRPAGPPRADILFVHGHADRLDNHQRQFAAWVRAGYRVISFDLPSHGQTDALPIDVWTFADLDRLVGLVELSTRDNPDRPLVLAGWSFGALLVTRLLQQPAARAALGRPIRAAVLLAPAIYPLLLPGGDGISRLAALTHDPAPPVAGPPHPASPLADPVFAARLLYEAAVAGRTDLPPDVPTLVAVADDRADRYVDSGAVLRWARSNRSTGAPVTIMQCAAARHALDLEPWPVGPAVVEATTRFVSAAVGGRRYEPAGGGTCAGR